MPGPSFSQLFRATSDAVFINDGEWVVDCNEAAGRLYGLRVDQIIGRRISDLVPEDFVGPLGARAARVERREERDRLTQEEILLPDGTRVPVLVRSIPFDAAGRPRLMVLIRRLDASSFVHPDTDSERAELFTAVSLRLAAASDEELDEIITDVLRQIAETEHVDRAYVVEFLAGTKLLSCTHEWCAEGIEPQIDFVQNLPEGDFTFSGGLLRSGEVFYAPDINALPDEAAAERESFGVYGVQSILQVPMWISGRAFGVVGFNSVRSSRTWSDTSISLLQAVADAMATALVRRRAFVEAERARQQAEAANESKDHFLSRVSHELRTPLNAVLGFTELLLLDDDRSPSDSEALEQISSSGGFLLTLVEDLLDISRIESGNLPLSTEPVNLTDAVGGAEAMIVSAGIDAGVDLKVELDGDLPLVMADLQRLRQVIVNLVSNACKYNRPGGQVRVSGVREDRWVQLRVEDTGIGIPPELLARVFEPFDRLGREHSGVEGTGIGLTLTRSLVELMGGTISVASEVDVGTTVSVVLPVAGGASARTSNPAHAVAVDPNLVAVLDMSASTRNLMRYLVAESEHLEFFGASSTHDLLGLFADRLPAVLFAELEADDAARSRFLDVLEADARFRRIPVVIVSGAGERRMLQRAIEAGAVDFLPKPAGVDRLRQLIATYTT